MKKEEQTPDWDSGLDFPGRLWGGPGVVFILGCSACALLTSSASQLVFFHGRLILGTVLVFSEGPESVPWVTGLERKLFCRDLQLCRKRGVSRETLWDSCVTILPSPHRPLLRKVPVTLYSVFQAAGVKNGNIDIWSPCAHLAISLLWFNCFL